MANSITVDDRILGILKPTRADNEYFNYWLCTQGRIEFYITADVLASECDLRYARETMTRIDGLINDAKNYATHILNSPQPTYTFVMPISDEEFSAGLTMHNGPEVCFSINQTAIFLFDQPHRELEDFYVSVRFVAGEFINAEHEPC